MDIILVRQHNVYNFFLPQRFLTGGQENILVWGGRTNFPNKMQVKITFPSMWREGIRVIRHVDFFPRIFWILDQAIIFNWYFQVTNINKVHYRKQMPQITDCNRNDKFQQWRWTYRFSWDYKWEPPENWIIQIWITNIWLYIQFIIMYSITLHSIMV